MKIPNLSQCRTGLRFISAVLCSLSLKASAFAQAPWGTPLTHPGVAAATCAGPAKDQFGVAIAPSDAFTFGLLDLRSPSATNYVGCTPTVECAHVS
jgi:hypothetical protein